ncbi:MAG: AMP-binding protein, partial [Thermodesulfobacteriota bacterium]
MSVERIWQGSYPPGVPRELDVETMTLPEILTRTAGRFPNVTALVFMGKKISYRELEASVNRFAGALTAIGVKAGDTVGMLLPNMPQLVIAAYAAMRIGAVAVPHNPLASEEDLIRQCRESGPAVLITLDLLFPRALDVKEKTGIRSIIVCHVPDYLPFPGNFLLRYAHKDLYRKIAPAQGIHEFLALLGAHPATPVENRARWEEAGTILYTDGTTGAGKGVMLTHANLSCSARQLRAWLPDLQDGKESMLAAIPFFHGAGWTAIQNLSILAGWTDILVPRPEAQVVMDIMGKHRPTVLPAMPDVYGS